MQAAPQFWAARPTILSSSSPCAAPLIIAACVGRGCAPPGLPPSAAEPHMQGVLGAACGVELGGWGTFGLAEGQGGRISPRRWCHRNPLVARNPLTPVAAQTDTGPWSYESIIVWQVVGRWRLKAAAARPPRCPAPLLWPAAAFPSLAACLAPLILAHKHSNIAGSSPRGAQQQSWLSRYRQCSPPCPASPRPPTPDPTAKRCNHNNAAMY